MARRRRGRALERPRRDLRHLRRRQDAVHHEPARAARSAWAPTSASATSRTTTATTSPSPGAHFYDLWNAALPYNPLADRQSDARASRGDHRAARHGRIAARAFTRLGHRQLAKLQDALEERIRGEAATHNGLPDLWTSTSCSTTTCAASSATSPGHELFGDGPPLGAHRRRRIFGLNHIPGTGLTTTLAAGFILPALYLKLLEMPQVANWSTTRSSSTRHTAWPTSTRSHDGPGVPQQGPGGHPRDAAPGRSARRSRDKRADEDLHAAAGRPVGDGSRTDPRPDRPRTFQRDPVAEGRRSVRRIRRRPPQLVKLRQFWRDHRWQTT